MIRKNLLKPIYLKQLEAASRRLNRNHPNWSKMEEWRSRQAAGFAGEKSLEHPLLKLSSEHYHIFHDLRLLQPDHSFFQIDVLLVTYSYAIILEVKNISGTSYFDSVHSQLIRQKEGIESGFPDPICQVKRQKLHLENWLLHHHFTVPPISTLIVFANRTSIIKSSSNHTAAANQVVRVENLLAAIQDIDYRYSELVIDKSEINFLSETLLKHHIPYHPNILNLFQLKQQDILTGVACPECNALPMKRLHSRWYCPSCHATSRSAHLAALKDYQLLFGQRITNKQLREFLRLPSSDTAHRILAGMKLNKFGTKKGSYYLLK